MYNVSGMSRNAHKNDKIKEIILQKLIYGICSIMTTFKGSIIIG